MPEVVRARGDPADLAAIVGRAARAGCERFLRVPYRSAIAATSARPTSLRSSSFGGPP